MCDRIHLAGQGYPRTQAGVVIEQLQAALVTLDAGRVVADLDGKGLGEALDGCAVALGIGCDLEGEVVGVVRGGVDLVRRAHLQGEVLGYGLCREEQAHFAAESLGLPAARFELGWPAAFQLDGIV